MSKTVDQRVVEMRFDNQHFEKNVKTSMSTLDRLKKSLNLSGASKGLENINAAAKNNNMGLLGAAVEQVGVKFSAMQIAGITAVSRLTNSVITSANRMAKALTIDPVTSGFNEYELKMGSIQTIMASTGEELDAVNRYLDELNEYSDKTIYSFQDMTSNIGKFTNAGVKLEDAVAAMKGISNEAAVSGANANEASRAMYNFAQALSAGYVKLIDWKSIELANMATVEFKEQLIQTAVEMGTLTKASDGMYKTLKGNTLNATKNFNDTLQDEWMTSEVLISTLKRYSDETTEIGKKATQAATQVKTFTQMLDALKESAQSGWAQTWQIVFGDFYEARDLWTSINNVVGGILDKMSDVRNAVLSKALSSPWSKVEKEISKSGIAMDDFKKSLLKTAKKHKLVTNQMLESENAFSDALAKGAITKEVVIETLQDYIKGADGVSESTEDMNDKLKKFQKVVDQVWRGDFKNGQERIEELTKAGYDYAEVQALVNKTVNGHKLTLEDLSDAQLKSVGYTNDEIKKLRELEEQAKKTGTPLNELLETLSRPTGRFLLLETFSNFAKEITKLTDGIKDAWGEVFGDIDMGEGIYSVIDTLHSLSEEFSISEENATAFKDIMTGVFSGLDLTFTLAGKGLVGSLKILNAVLNLFGTDILGLMAFVANRITDLDKWLREHTLVWNQVENVAKIIHAVLQGLYDCAKAFIDLDKASEALTNFRKKISEIFDIDLKLKDFSVDELVANINAFFDTLEGYIKEGKFKEFGQHIIDGLVEGIIEGLPNIGTAIFKLANTIIDTFCDLLGIHSPSKVFIALGGFVILGLAKGITGGAEYLYTTIKNFISNMLDVASDGIQNGVPYLITSIAELAGNLIDALKMCDVDFGAIFVGGTLIGALLLVKKIADITEGLVSPVKKIGAFLGSLTNAITNLQKAMTYKLKADAVKSLAISVAILAGSMVLLSTLDWDDIARGGTALMGIILGLTMMVKAVEGIDLGSVGKLAGLIVGLSVSLLIISFAIRSLSKVTGTEALTAIGELALVLAAVAGLFAIYGQFVKGKTAQNISKGGTFLIKMAIAIGLMAFVIKLVSKLEPSELKKGIATVAALELMAAGIILISQYSGKRADKAAALIGKVGAAMLVMAVVMKIIAAMSYEDIAKGLAVIAGFALIIGVLTLVSKELVTSKDQTVKAGGVILKMSVAIGLMAMTIKLLSTVSVEDTIKGVAVITGFVLLCKLFAEAVKTIDNANIGKIGTALIGMSVGIMLMTVSIRLLAGVSIGDITKGLITITALTGLYSAIIYMTKYIEPNADKIAPVLLKMSAGILILVGAIALLSLLKPEKVAIGTAAVSALMLCFSLMIKATSTMKASKSAQKTLLEMAIIIGAYAGIIALLSLLDPESVVTNTAALGTLMITFAASLNIMSKSSRVLPTVKKTMPMMLAVATGLAGLILILSSADPTSALAGSAALSLLLTSFAGSLTILGAAGRISTTVSKQLGPMLLVTAGLAAIIGILAAFKLEGSIETAASLSILLLSFSVAVGILGTIGAVGAAGIDLGLVALAKLVVGVGVLATILGGLEKLTNGGFGNVLDKGTEIMIKLGEFIGGFVGGIVGGFAEGATSTLPTIGQNLSDFMTNASIFIEGAKGIDESVANGTKALAEAILILTGAGVLESLTSWITGGSSLESFGSQMASLGEGIKGFADAVVDVDDGGVEPAIKILKSILSMTDNIPKSGGLAQLFTGENNLGAFASQLPAVGTSLSQFAYNLGTFSDAQVDTIDCGIRALKTMAKASEGIDGQSTLGKVLFGDNDISTFASQLPSVGTSLSQFATNLGTFSDAQVSTIDCGIKALKSMIKAGEGINGQSEWGKALFGDNSIATFTSQLPVVGTALGQFATNLGTFSDDQVASIKCAANAIKVMAEAGSNVDGQSEWAKALFGDNGLGAFSEDLPAVATNLSEFVTNLGTFGEEKIATVNVVVEVVKALAELGNVNLSTVSTNLPNFGTKLVGFAEDLKSFCSEMADVESGSISTTLSDLVTSIADTATKISDTKTKFETAGNSLITGLKDGINLNADTVSSACEKIVTTAKKAITDKKSNFKEAGKTLVKEMKTALSDDTTVKTAAEDLAKEAADGASDKKSSFESAGKDLGDGLVAGIEAKYSAAYDAGYELGRQAVQGEKDGQASNSPSKLTIKAGKWLGEGLIVGIDRISTKVYKAGHNLGEDATNSISSAVSRMSEAINTDIDDQPTIRPVLDLSNIQSGAKSLNGIFGNKNIGVVSSIMSRRSQNGGNDDVVSAINKLSKKLGDIGTTTYNINGVRADGDSDVENAIKVLVRAAKVEGRA